MKRVCERERERKREREGKRERGREGEREKEGGIVVAGFPGCGHAEFISTPYIASIKHARTLSVPHSVSLSVSQDA